MQRKTRNSKQRNRILEILRHSQDHPTATSIYDRLKPEFPSLSLGNVYRNLNILVEQGNARRLNFGTTFDRFEAGIDEHVHFICESCGTIYDLELEDFDQLEERVHEETGHTVQSRRVEMHGVCATCSEG